IGSAVAALDPDEPIGSKNFIVSESSLIATNLHTLLHGDLRQPSTTLGGAWYQVDGFADASFRFFPGDHENGILTPPSRQTLESEREHIIRNGRRCVEAGKIVRFTKTGFLEKHQIFVNYPFLTYRN